MTQRLTRCRRPAPEREHGDWRLPLDRPEEAEHLPVLPLSLWQRVQHQAVTWQQAEPEPAIVPISGWTRALRLVLAVLVLLPLYFVTIIALGMQLYRATPTMADMGFWLTDSVWFTCVGFVGFMVLVLVGLAQPLFVCVYVLGHESTHALAALLCFGKVNAFHVDADGGYVETDTDNLFISLSPYFVPFWMLVWMLLFWAGNALWAIPEYEAWFYGGFGFWWAFHLYWTCWVIPREQPDMLENGLLFSLLIILLANMGVLLGILWCFGIITPHGYGAEMGRVTLELWESLQALGQWLGLLLG